MERLGQVASRHRVLASLVLNDNSYSFMLGCGYYESYRDQLIETGSSDA